jgi:hypothetical protein
MGWRAAQIGSTAAFDDRQSISETVSVEQDAVARAVAVAADAREYVRYRADYAVAAALDYRARAQALAAEESTAIDSPAKLDPGRWAQAANDIRVRVRDWRR